MLVITLHNFATLFGTYYQYLWFDSLMHFLGGVSIAISAHYYLEHSKNKLGYFTYLIFITAVTALAAVAWEFVEFAGDYYLMTNMQPSIKDTLKDLFIGINAALVTAIIISNKK